MEEKGFSDEILIIDAKIKAKVKIANSLLYRAPNSCANLRDGAIVDFKTNFKRYSDRDRPSAR